MQAASECWSCNYLCCYIQHLSTSAKALVFLQNKTESTSEEKPQTEKERRAEERRLGLRSGIRPDQSPGKTKKNKNHFVSGNLSLFNDRSIFYMN